MQFKSFHWFGHHDEYPAVYPDLELIRGLLAEGGRFSFAFPVVFFFFCNFFFFLHKIRRAKKSRAPPLHSPLIPCFTNMVSVHVIFQVFLYLSYFSFGGRGIFNNTIFNILLLSAFWIRDDPSKLNAMCIVACLPSNIFENSPSCFIYCQISF